MLFMMKVIMVRHFVSGSHKVTTALIAWYLQVVVMEVSLQFHKYAILTY